MKKTILAMILIGLFTGAAMAQTVSAAAPQGKKNSAWNAPHATGTIVFYGGDINPTDPNYFAFANENTLMVPQSQTYAAVQVPVKATVSAIFINTTSTVGGVFDPATGTYDIRTGVTEGNGGKSIAHGSGAQTAVATGREPFGLPEYTLSVTFARPLTGVAGTTYWANETPQCTNSSDNSCASAQYYLDNTTQETNGVNAADQPAAQLYLNSFYYGFTWANWCDSALGLNKSQCARASFGFTD
jgi:hypothetical protein